MISLQQYRALREASGLIDRSRRGRLRLTGNDRRDYLQGLLTNDIAALTPGTGCYACLLTAQGRMVADMYVFETGDAIVMDLETEITRTVFDHLEKFIFAEDVRVEDVSASLAQLGVYGPHASRVVGAVMPGVLAFERDDVGVGGVDLFVETARAGALAAALRDAGAIEIDADVVEVCRVEGGIPVFHRDMDEDTIPLEAGLEDRAISQTKGCYVGQEIIIRVLHRGQGRVARRLVGLTLDAGAPLPTPGDRIRSGDREIGSITSAVVSPALQRPIAMGYVHRDFVAPSTSVAIVSGEVAAPASVVALPFVSRAPEGPTATQSAPHRPAETPAS